MAQVQDSRLQDMVLKAAWYACDMLESLRW